MFLFGNVLFFEQTNRTQKTQKWREKKKKTHTHIQVYYPRATHLQLSVATHYSSFVISQLLHYYHHLKVSIYFVFMPKKKHQQNTNSNKNAKTQKHKNKKTTKNKKHILAHTM